MAELIRIRFSKGDPIRYISHLDLQRIFGRALKKAKIPVAYSQGFNPHPKLSFGSALSVGTTSDSEYIDIDLAEHLDAADFIDRMNQILPLGLKIEAAKSYVTGEDVKKLPTLMSVMNAAEYRISLYRVPDTNAGVDLEKQVGETEVPNNDVETTTELAVAVDDALKTIADVPEWIVTRTNGKKQRQLDIKPFVYHIESNVDSASVVLTTVVQTGSEANVRPAELLEVLAVYGGLSGVLCMVHRSKLGIYEDGVILEPFPY